MNILVTGANGQLGSCIKKASLRAIDNYFFTDVDELDITDKKAVNEFVKSNGITLIINCAAYTNVDKAESEPILAELLNSKAVKTLAETLKNVNGTLFHISTDYVFGGNAGNTPRTEEEPVNPTGVYGLTKLRGERVIFRTAWLYSEYGKNFVKTMMNLTKTQPELKVVFDQIGTPTYAQDLADAIVSIIDNRLFENKEGIYHYSNEGVISWYDFTKAIVDLTSQKECNIQPCHSNEFPSTVNRPSFSVLDKTKFKKTFNIEIPYWRDSLRYCVSNLIDSNEA